MSRLRDLDEKVVPRLAEKAASMSGRFPKGAEPEGPLPVVLRLRRVDDRWTAAGPLALIREVPQLGALVLALIVLVGGFTAYSRDDRRAADPDGAPVAEELAELEDDDGTLGPVIGQSVDEYLNETRAKLTRAGVGRPDGTVLAVVSLAQYQTPEAVRDLLGTSMQVQMVFYRVPGPTGVINDARVQDVVGDTKRAFRKTAAQRLKDAQEMLSFAATIDNDPAQKAEHEKDAALIKREVRALRGRCACVFAVVVRAQLRTLLDAANLRTFRAIDVSRIDAKLGDYTYKALVPGDKDIVTGGNAKQ